MGLSPLSDFAASMSLWRVRWSPTAAQEKIGAWPLSQESAEPKPHSAARSNDPAVAAKSMPSFPDLPHSRTMFPEPTAAAALLRTAGYPKSAKAESRRTEVSPFRLIYQFLMFMFYPHLAVRGFLILWVVRRSVAYFFRKSYFKHQNWNISPGKLDKFVAELNITALWSLN